MRSSTVSERLREVRLPSEGEPIYLDRSGLTTLEGLIDSLATSAQEGVRLYSEAQAALSNNIAALNRDVEAWNHIGETSRRSEEGRASSRRPSQPVDREEFSAFFDRWIPANGNDHPRHNSNNNARWVQDMLSEFDSLGMRHRGTPPR